MRLAAVISEIELLNPQDRADVLAKLCELQEKDVLAGVGPTHEERELLDEELQKFLQDNDRGASWRNVLAQLLAGRTGNGCP